MSRFRVTYATLSADNEDLQAAYDEGVRVARSWFGETLPGYVSGQPRTGGPTFEVVSPADQSVDVPRARGHPADIEDAVAAAAAAAPGWAATPWQERIALLRAAADLISDRSSELAALMSMEVGQEPAGGARGRRGDRGPDPLLLHADRGQRRLQSHRWTRLSEHEATHSVMRPYGVWAVIAPFNFPMALAGGPAGGALAAGNTVVIKPSMQGSFSGVQAV